MQDQVSTGYNTTQYHTFVTTLTSNSSGSPIFRSLLSFSVHVGTCKVCCVSTQNKLHDSAFSSLTIVALRVFAKKSTRMESEQPTVRVQKVSQVKMTRTCVPRSEFCDELDVPVRHWLWCGVLLYPDGRELGSFHVLSCLLNSCAK